MLRDLVLGMSEHLLSAGLFFLLFFVLMTLLIARERFVPFLGSLAMVLLSIVAAPLRYVSAGVREMADDTLRLEGPERNRQYLLQQMLSALRAVLVILALSTMAVGFAVGWKAMVPTKEMRDGLKTATAALTAANQEVSDLRAKLPEQRRVWKSESDDRLGESLADLRRRAQEHETAARSAAEGFSAATSLKLPDDVFGNLLDVDTPEEVNEFADHVRRDIAWARTGPVTRFGAPQLQQLESWLRGWHETEHAFLRFGSELRAQLASAEQRLTDAGTQHAQYREANRWKHEPFFWAVLRAFVSMLVTIWVLGLLLESVWLGVDMATNIRALRRAGQAQSEREE